MPRLRLRPRGLIPGISFGREPSNSTGGTFTRVASGFPGARHFFGQLINPNKDRAAAHETSCPQQAVVRTKPESSRLACRQNLVTGLNDLTVDATTGECPGHFT